MVGPQNIRKMEELERLDQGLVLPLSRDELRWDHIVKLGEAGARTLLDRVLQAKFEVKALSRRLKVTVEAGVLRGILLMAENDLCALLHVEPERQFPRLPKRLRPRRTGRGPRGGYYRERTEKR